MQVWCVMSSDFLQTKAICKTYALAVAFVEQHVGIGNCEIIDRWFYTDESQWK